jgi:hypothetical protein
LQEISPIRILALKFLDTKLSTPSLDKWNAIEVSNVDPNLVLQNDMRFVIKGRKKDIADFLKF